MKLLEAVKVSLVAGLVVVIFALPTLTATQLVQVLGTSTTSNPVAGIVVMPNSTSDTYVSQQPGVVVVSYLKSGNFQPFSIKNNSITSQTIDFKVASSDKSIQDQVVTLTIGANSYPLFSNSTTPIQAGYILNLSPGQSFPAYLKVSGQTSPIYGTISIYIRGN